MPLKVKDTFKADYTFSTIALFFVLCFSFLFCYLSATSHNLMMLSFYHCFTFLITCYFSSKLHTRRQGIYKSGSVLTAYAYNYLCKIGVFQAFPQSQFSLICLLFSLLSLFLGSHSTEAFFISIASKVSRRYNRRKLPDPFMFDRHKEIYL